MGDFSDSIAEAIRKRVVSASLGTYFFFWVTLHWEGVYATLFVSQELIYEKFGMLKNEYVREYFFGWHGWDTLWLYLLPAVLTVIFIWPAPKYLLIHLYRQEQRHKVDRRRIRIEEEEKLQAARKSLANTEKEAVVAEAKASKEIKKAAETDPTILWNKELIHFIDQTNGKMALESLKQTIYKDSGHLTSYRTPAGAYSNVNGMSFELLALVDTNGLIDFDKDSQMIELTEKGKYFLARVSAVAEIPH